MQMLTPGTKEHHLSGQHCAASAAGLSLSPARSPRPLVVAQSQAAAPTPDGAEDMPYLDGAQTAAVEGGTISHLSPSI